MGTLHAGEGGEPSALARYWNATWTNLVALAFCIAWLAITQTVAAFRLLGWLFTMPARLFVGAAPVKASPLPAPPIASVEPPREERRRAPRLPSTPGESN